MRISVAAPREPHGRGARATRSPANASRRAVRERLVATGVLIALTTFSRAEGLIS